MKETLVKSICLNTFGHPEIDTIAINDNAVQKVVDRMNQNGFSLVKVIPIMNSRVDDNLTDENHNSAGLTLFS